jgi:hypothetical protein
VLPRITTDKSYTPDIRYTDSTSWNLYIRSATSSEKEKVIIDYAAMIDWRKVDGLEGVTAMIDVKVTPKRLTSCCRE